jgi:hypothetical protein
MFNNIKRVAAVIALTGWMGFANASLIFDFSYGTTGNELIGEITGLVEGRDGKIQSAVSLRITNATGYYAAFLPIVFDHADSFTTTTNNQFVIENKMLVISGLEFSFRYYDLIPAVFTHYEFMLYEGTNVHIFKRSDLTYMGDIIEANANDFNGFVLRVDSPKPAPEPSAVFLLALGLAGVSFSHYKKKS